MNPAAAPPYYILCSHSTSGSNPIIQSNTLGHPVIQYHYADDSPLSLLPQSPDELVLILDYDPASPSPPIVRSASKDMIITGLKITEAPGAAAADEGGPPRNDRMYIIETTVKDEKHMETSQGERRSPQATLAQFKQRNAVLRQALVYPDEEDTVLKER